MKKANPFKQWRISNDLKQHEAADKIGVTQATYSRYETGAMKPSPEKAIVLEKRMGIPREQLIWSS